MSEIEKARAAAAAEIAAAKDAAAVEALKTKYLGRKGLVRELFGQIGKQPEHERGAFGQALNALKTEIERRLNERASIVGTVVEPKAAAAPFDVTMPGSAPTLGRYHPIYATWREVERVFETLGFATVTGPEIETTFNNFDALNIPSDHPSADAFDTFFITDKLLMRSHTSPVQIRAMKERKPPLRIIAPGKVFRPDAIDKRHHAMFHQVEGLMVGEDVSFAHLKTVLTLFARAMFGSDTKMRFRPSFFPFTEPSADVEVTCPICKGKGCPTCGSGWLEILGSGMVHPKVFEAVGYDPERWTGFAFGMGIERIAMIRYTNEDIRWFTENRFDFLRQVGS